MKQYRKCLKSTQPSTTKKPRSAYVKVLYPQKDRTEYELVYLTRHPLGIVVFMEESAKLDIIQKKVRAQAKQDRRVEKSGQQEFSSAFTELNHSGLKVQRLKTHGLKVRYSNMKFSASSLGRSL